MNPNPIILSEPGAVSSNGDHGNVNRSATGNEPKQVPLAVAVLKFGLMSRLRDFALGAKLEWLTGPGTSSIGSPRGTLADSGGILCVPLLGQFPGTVNASARRWINGGLLVAGVWGSCQGFAFPQ